MPEVNARRSKLSRLRAESADPYPARVNRTHKILDILRELSALEGKEVSIVGRIRAIREHGGSVFADLEDSSGKIQLYFKKDILGGGKLGFFSRYIDLGDFLEATGSPFITKKGERSILVNDFRLISKVLRPLPQQWHGLKDIEKRLRKRYLDLLTNKYASGLFMKRAHFIQAIRKFLEEHEFLEVETPVLEHTPGGADALPFSTHHNALGIDLYLRISLELHLKRLLVGGFERVFEIGKVFRNEGMSREHLQEFTMLEFYWAFEDYQSLMGFTEKMYFHILNEVFGRHYIEREGERLDFSPPWPRLDYFDFFKERTGIDLESLESEEELKKEVKKLKLRDIDLKLGEGRIIDQVYKRLVRPNIKGPVFLTNHPLSISPLAKKTEDNPKKTERFQVIAFGSEIGNAFSELNDSQDQRQRFLEQMKLRDRGDKEAHMLDEDFIEALEYGMPPSAGFGVGVDRLFMLFSGASSIRETVLFPQMRN